MEWNSSIVFIYRRTVFTYLRLEVELTIFTITTRQMYMYLRHLILTNRAEAQKAKYKANITWMCGELLGYWETHKKTSITIYTLKA
jgi:hypothetical protein